MRYCGRSFGLTLMMLGIALATSVARGATTWTGAVDDDWFDASNWTAGVPNTNDDVLVPSGLLRYPVLTGTARCQDLVIQTGGTLTLVGETVEIRDDLAIEDPTAIVGPGRIHFRRGSIFDIAAVFLPVDFAGEIVCDKPLLSPLILAADIRCGDLTISRGLVLLSNVGQAHNVESLTIDRRGIVDCGDASLSVRNDVTLGGTLIDVDPSGGDTRVGGDWTSDGTHVASSQRVVFDGGSTSRIVATGTADFATVRVENGTRVTAMSELEIGENLVVDDGTFRIDDGRAVSVLRNARVRGTLDVQPGSTLSLGNGSALAVEAGGLLELLGDASPTGDLALITSVAPPGRYAFTIQPGGRVRAAYAYVRYTDTNGLHIIDTPFVDAIDRLDHTFFDEGAPGGRLLRIDGNDDPHTLSSLQFFDTNANLAFNVETNGAVEPIVIDPYDDDTNGTGFGGPAGENDNSAGTVNPGFVQWGTTTPVVLRDFRAVTQAAGCDVEWMTDAEWRVAGFQVERHDRNRLAWTSPVVPARGGAAGDRYTCRDPRPVSVSTRYELVLIDRFGHRSTIGRATPSLGSASASAALVAAPTGPPAAPPASTAAPAASRAALRVDSSGVIRVDAMDLARVGVDATGPISRLSVERLGEPWPFTIEGGADGTFDPGDTILFVAPTMPSIIPDTTEVYTVRTDGTGGLALEEIDGTQWSVATPLDTTPARSTRADNALYVASLIDGEGRDHFFDTLLVTTAVAGDFASFPIAIHDAHWGAAATLTVSGEAVTADPLGTPDHHLRVAIDGTIVGDLEHNGIGPFGATFEIPGVLAPGVHDVTIDTIPTGALGLLFVESIELGYLRSTRAV
ncbi:MAG: hypothetical protein KDC38_10525, partial [Planctomycetes bacterium]|nr:hypothetical protein [Planctomycetota bacterium]